MYFRYFDLTNSLPFTAKIERLIDSSLVSVFTFVIPIASAEALSKLGAAFRIVR